MPPFPLNFTKVHLLLNTHRAPSTPARTPMFINPLSKTMVFTFQGNNRKPRKQFRVCGIGRYSRGGIKYWFREEKASGKFQNFPNPFLGSPGLPSERNLRNGVSLCKGLARFQVFLAHSSNPS